MAGEYGGVKGIYSSRVDSRSFIILLRLRSLNRTRKTFENSPQALHSRYYRR